MGASYAGKAPPGGPLPACAGVGLRSVHLRQVLAEQPAIPWFEIHSENVFAEGGFPVASLARIRESYPVSLHGIGLSLGSADPLNEAHLARLGAAVERFVPALVSEHLSWSSIGGRYLNDLLPLPYTEEALSHMVSRVGIVQDRLRRRILIENPSAYLVCEDADYSEWDFLVALARRSGCGVLLDVNNLYVNSVNQGFDPRTYMAAIPGTLVEEIHLAGFSVQNVDGHEILIDTHNQRVWPAVWELYRETMAMLGPRPTLIEWDADIPPLAVLMAEAAQADRIMEAICDNAC